MFLGQAALQRVGLFVRAGLSYGLLARVVCYGLPEVPGWGRLQLYIVHCRR